MAKKLKVTKEKKATPGSLRRASIAELCKKHGIPSEDKTKEYQGTTTLMFTPWRTKEEAGMNTEPDINRFFDDSSKKSRKRPTFTIIMGGVCVGKTQLRKEGYSDGYVTIDAAEIFLSLCHGEDLDFPSIHEKAMEKLGSSIALRAFTEKRNIVTEIIGANLEEMTSLIDAIESAGYKLILIPLIGDIAETWTRNVNRGIDNISAYYCEPYHIKWIHSALRRKSNKALNKQAK